MKIKVPGTQKDNTELNKWAVWKEELSCASVHVEGAYKEESVILCWTAIFIAVLSRDSVHQNPTSQIPRNPPGTKANSFQIPQKLILPQISWRKKKTLHSAYQ